MKHFSMPGLVTNGMHGVPRVSGARGAPPAPGWRKRNFLPKEVFNRKGTYD